MSVKQRQLGQGMTEYIIVVALVAVAAIAVYQLFGQVVRSQTAAMARELAGEDGSAQARAAQSAAGRAACRHGRVRSSRSPAMPRAPNEADSRGRHAPGGPGIGAGPGAHGAGRHGVAGPVRAGPARRRTGAVAAGDGCRRLQRGRGQARALNLLAYIHRAQVGHQVALAHLASLAAWARFAQTQAARLLHRIRRSP